MGSVEDAFADEVQLRIWVTSPHQLVEMGLRSLLREQGFEVADTLDDTVDVAVVDLCRSGPPYPGALPDVPTLALVSDHDSELPSILRKGYRGYLRDDDDLSTLRLAVNALLSGEVWAERKILSILAGLGSRQLPTDRQEQVARLIDAGHSNREIAEQLGISVSTVKAHVTSLLHKFGVKNRLQLVARRKQEGTADEVH